jgi:hypothetical protein
MLSPNWHENAFEADSEGPPKRKLYVWQEKPGATPEVVGGWAFSVSRFDSADQELPLWDTWEATFSEILRYPPEYAPRDITWRRTGDGEAVDLYSLNN